MRKRIENIFIKLSLGYMRMREDSQNNASCIYYKHQAICLESRPHKGLDYIITAQKVNLIEGTYPPSIKSKWAIQPTL